MNSAMMTFSKIYNAFIMIVGGALCGLFGAWLFYAALSGALLWLAPVGGAAYGLMLYRRRRTRLIQVAASWCRALKVPG
jgi:hypothetical protein